MGGSVRAWRGLLATLLLVAGCASGGRGGPAVRILVNNNLVPPTPVSVYMLSQTGQERYLGMVVSSSTNTVLYQGLPPVGEYRLVARSETSNRRIVSNIVLMDGVTALEWSLENNLVEIRATTRGD